MAIVVGGVSVVRKQMVSAMLISNDGQNLPPTLADHEGALVSRQLTLDSCFVAETVLQLLKDLLVRQVPHHGL